MSLNVEILTPLAEWSNISMNLALLHSEDPIAFFSYWYMTFALLRGRKQNSAFAEQ